MAASGKTSAAASRDEAHLSAYLLGTVELERCLALQQRLVYETGGRAEPHISLILCEHSPAISVGRQGSHSHLRLSTRELEQRNLPVRWVNRGGGCIVHGPGQLAVYPIVPVERLGWTVGAYLERLQAGLQTAMAELRLSLERPAPRFGLWGRTGQVVAIGAAVKGGVSYFGAYISVSPALGQSSRVVTDVMAGEPLSSLSAERHQPVKMNQVREAVMRCVAGAFDQSRYHVFTGHPLLTEGARRKEVAARAG